MNKKEANLFSSLWILLYLLLLAFSWFAWYQAKNDPNLIYLPLRSFFLAVQSNVDLPSWILAHPTIKPSGFYKIFHEISMWLVVIAHAALFIYGFRKLSPKNEKNFLDTKKITYLSIAVCTLACFLIPQDSSDLFGYIARGAQQVFEDQNPFSQVVASIPDWRENPFYASTLWPKNPSPYGPLFMFMCKMSVLFSQGNFWLGLLTFKIRNLLVFLVMLFTFRKLQKNIELSREDKDLEKDFQCEIAATKNFSPEQLYYLLALNPLIIMECMWNGHNDIIMAGFIFFGVYCTLRNRFNEAFFLVSIGTLVKYLGVVIMPIILICNMFKSSSRLPWVGLLISGELAYILFDRFFHSATRISAMKSNLILSHKSLYDSLNSLFKYVSGGHELPKIMITVFLAAYAIILSLLLYRLASSFFRKKPYKEIGRTSFLALFILICFASAKFHSWYIIAFLSLAIVYEPVLALYLSVSHLLSFTFLDQANIANFLIMTLAPFLLFLKEKKSQKSLLGLY